MSRGAYDTRAPSASAQIITLERMLEEAETLNDTLQAENDMLWQEATTLLDNLLGPNEEGTLYTVQVGFIDSLRAALLPDTGGNEDE